MLESNLLTRCVNNDQMSAERLYNLDSFFAVHYFSDEFAAICTCFIIGVIHGDF